MAFKNSNKCSDNLHNNSLHNKILVVRIFNHNDIIGKRFGLLTVEKFLYKKGKTPIKYFYMCTCECGKKKKIQRCNLITNDHTRSCGCLREIKGQDNKFWKGYKDLSSAQWRSIKSKAKYRNLDFKISIKESWNLFVKQKGLCALTGVSIKLRVNKGKEYTASLDRINNNKGYVKGNIQWVHKDINWMKGTFSQKQFIELCKLVTLKNKKL